MPEVAPVSSPVLGMLITLGNLAIWLGFASALLTVAFYWASMIRAIRKSKATPAAEPANGGKKGGKKAAGETGDLDAADKPALWGRRFFYASSAFFVLGAVCLWTLIFQQEYIVRYIWKNSNSSLHPGFRFASLWGDQEGTFFLWGMMNAALGGVLLWKARSDEKWVMPFFTLVNVSLFALLTFMNPFWLHSPSDIRSGLGANATPESLAFLPSTQLQHLAYYFGWAKYFPIQNGKGLNESLQNFWMVIHPPTLFVGYSSMMVPAAFALGALMKRDYDTWVVRAAPWLMFSWTILGLGIFLGAYWAYETLGWGGYWSWDPVENSSIIPWVVGTALIHGLLGQRNRGNYKQANLFLGAMAGTSVMLGSFLVRSGVLSETSVHAFASPQQSVFNILLTVLILYFVMSVGIWLWRFKDIQSEIAYDTVWERHFGFFLGMIVLSATAVVIIFGVFFVPVLLPMVMKNKISIPYTFYNQALIPVMFVTVLLMAITPLMPWRKAREEGRPLGAFEKTVLGLCGLVTAFFLFAAVKAWMGGFKLHTGTGSDWVPFPHAVNDLAYLAFMMMIGVALIPTFVCLWRARRGGWLNTGPWVAHLGFLLMLFGVVYTSRFNRVYPVDGLRVGEVAKDEKGDLILGREFRFTGERMAANPADRDRMLIEMRKGSLVRTFDPKIFISRQNERGDGMAWPQIYGEGLDDIYISPQGVNPKPIDGVEGLQKEKPISLSIADAGEPAKKATLVFHGLDMAEFQKAIQGQLSGAPTLYADVSVTVDGQTHKVRPGILIAMKDGKPEFRPTHHAWIPGMNRVIALADLGLQPENVTATFLTAVPQGSFQVLHVPGIQILWWGCYIMIAGAAMCYRRRALLARRPVAVKQAEKAAPVRKPAPTGAPEPAGAE